MAKEIENKKSKSQKEFGLSSLAVNNRTTVIVLSVIIILGGIYAYIGMPKENFPDVVTPEIYVATMYPGNSPLDIEKLITRPFEKEINTISGVDEITSTSSQGHSTIKVKFDFSITPDEALRKVKDKIDVAMSERDFPTDLPADPNMFELNIAELMPIMNINLSGDYAIDQLKDYAEYLEDLIEDLPEITKVEIRGVMDKEVKIDVNLLAIEAMEISFDDISDAIAAENITISGGDLLVDNMRRNVRVIGEFTSMEEIENVIVKRDNQEVVYLKDIADISFGEKEKESYAREFGNPVVMVDIMKRAGENLIEASKKIENIVAQAQENVFPKDLNVSITNDTSDMTKTQVEELLNNIIFGIILVVGVLLFFLGLRNSLFVGIAIPISMLMSFLLLGAFGVTMNMVVLFALILALGMLVDNGIVVVENIYRHMDEGYSPIQAAKLGVGEVAVPIIASTATTLAAFLPLIFWPGLMGEFLFYLPVTLIVVLSASLFMALVINPVLTAMYMKIGEPDVNKKKMVRNSLIFFVFGILFDAVGFYSGIKEFFTFGNLLILIGIAGVLNVYLLLPGTEKFQFGVLPKLEVGYEKFLKFALGGKGPVMFFLGTFAMLILSFVLLYTFPPKVDFFPDNEPQQLNVFIEKPIGTDIEETNKVTMEIEKQVINFLDKYYTTDEHGNKTSHIIESVIAQVGEGAGDPRQGFSAGQTPHKSRIMVQFSKFQERKNISTEKILEEIRNELQDIPGTQIRVSKDEFGPPQGAPINIEVRGEDYEKLMHDAEALKAFIESKNVGGIEELKLDIETGKPEMPIIIDREKARRVNISTYQIGDAMRTALFGREVSTYKDGEDDYPINVRLQERFRESEDALMNMRLTFRDPATGKISQVPISSVATSQKTSTFSAVKRRDLDRVVTLSSNVLSGYNANEIVKRLRENLEEFDKDPDTEILFTGQQEEQAEEMNFLTTALAMALFLIILIITAQFNSISTPSIIFSSVIFSMIGVLLGLVIFRMDFVVIMTMIGIISLAGVVVNNAIVLIDYTNLIIVRKKEEMGIDNEELLPFAQVVEAVIEGGKTRLRPVLLTAITTVFGLVPLAMGLNINFFTLLSDFDPQIYVGGDNVMFWGPIAWTIIFGLTFATFLTLILVPVMYLLLSRAKYKYLHKQEVNYQIKKIDNNSVAS